MKVEYVVHSVATEPVQVRAMVGEHEVSAMVQGLTVELLGKGGHSSHGHTFRFVPMGDEAMAEHKAVFAVGNAVAVDFSLISAAE